MRKVYFSSQDANSSDVIQKGLETVLTEAQNLSAKSIWIVCPAKGNLSGHITSVIGQKAADELSKNGVTKLGTFQIFFYGEKTLPISGNDSPILVCYPPKKLLDKIDGMSRVPSLVVLPWLQKEIVDWVNAHAPVDIFGATITAPLSVTNPAVEKALEGLWAGINVSTGITHQLDKKKTTETFKTLQAAGEEYGIDEIRAWLVQKGMKPEDADDIAAIATRIKKSR